MFLKYFHVISLNLCLTITISADWSSLILVKRKARFRGELVHGSYGASKWQSQMKE